ncbi:hypothetical protein P154DRAFT_64105 [Amniculicola lignicola CBS 123094]|uniref:Uncharacterized protein n=1 Tax=Amniculicola lignicola CBS 123094 TaxID=1392246 RepID=A0A6A5WSG8_9PLEO|nr:hypothetical protein P154DRAFT_64105 [Amniculicola lignicola CBS 123094]
MIAELDPSSPRATHRTSPRSSNIWRMFRQRQPFGHLRLHPVDEILIDDTRLLPDEDQRKILSDEEKEQLWQGLLSGFKVNDRVGILSCLDRGAPLDREDSNGEYAIHLAARFGNLDIFKRTYAQRNLIPLLLLKTRIGETPLEIAVNETKSKSC